MDMYKSQDISREKRKCTKCEKAKMLTDFVFNKRSGNYLNYCIECYKQYHKDYYERRKVLNADKVVEIDSNATKRCIKCGVEKPLTEFSVDKASGKIINTCKACKTLLTRRYYLNNKEKRLTYAQEYRNAHKDKLNKYFAEYRIEHLEEKRAYDRQYNKDHEDEIKVKRRIYRQAHRDEFRERDKRYAEAHKEQISKRYKEWAKANAERLAEYNKRYRAKNSERLHKKSQEYGKKNRPRINAYIKNKRATDPLFKLSAQVRGLIRISLKNRGYGKDTHTYDILGCDYETLWEHLQQTWLENYGTEWNGEKYHIDHIIPLATAKTKQEVLDLCYYENLQLLKPKDNLTKNKYLNWSPQKENKT